MLRVSLVVSCIGLAAAQMPGQEDAFQGKVNRAIDEGVRILKQQQTEEGYWDGFSRVGATSLCAWTLLEAGIPKTDPALQKALKYVRRECLNLDFTYAPAVTIFFLDKLGDPADAPLIEALAAQLLATQTDYNGWSYSCPKLDAEDQDKVLSRVKSAQDAVPEGEPQGKKEKSDAARKVDASTLKMLGKLRVASRDLLQNVGDNSNTQFAMMALWVARRHGMPVDQALTRVEIRFRKSQHDAGSWGYELDGQNPKNSVDDYKGTPTFTCAGLLAYALGHGVKKDGKVKDLMQDPGVKTGMAALTKYLDKFSENKDVFFQEGKNYCFLWSLERMAVVYGLTKIGERDWYRWGADLLVNQLEKGGGWSGSYGTADTCFAILFLKRANVAEDLTRQLNLFNPIIKVPPPKKR